jgi:hypothetical protein
MIKLLLILFIVFCVLPVYSQQPVTIRKVYMEARTSSWDWFMTVVQANNHYTLEMKIRDSTSRDLGKDSSYNNYRNMLLTRKSISMNNDTVRHLLDTIMKISRRYDYYSKAVVEFDSASELAFDSLFNYLFEISDAELENKEITKNRIVLDGSLMVFTLSSGNMERKVFARSPDMKSYPLLSSLLYLSLEISRKNNAGFPEKNKVFGY